MAVSHINSLLRKIKNIFTTIPQEKQANEFFEGTYYKHQNKNKTVSVISGITKNSFFIQVITNEKSYYYTFPSIKHSKCIFNKNMIHLNLPEIKGEIEYINMSPIKYNIMGPFKLFPMECYHDIVSMHHKLKGTLLIENKFYDFNDGIGYIEKDAGTSFPKKYLWIHCNDFKENCSIMVSVAKIPFFFTSFTGSIAIVYYKGKEIRFATYLGAKIILAHKNHMVLKQGIYTLDIKIKPGKSYSLASPVQGKMLGIIHESNTTSAVFSLFKKGNLLLKVSSNNVSFEYEGINIYRKN